MTKSKLDFLKGFVDPLHELRDEELINYTFSKISVDIDKTYLNAKELLRSRFEGLSERELEEKEYKFLYRKIALQNANLENIAISYINVLSISVAILIALLGFTQFIINFFQNEVRSKAATEDLDKFVYDFFNDAAVFMIAVFLFLLVVSILVFFYAKRVESRITKKAKEIVYCELCLEVIEEVKTRKLEPKQVGESHSEQVKQSSEQNNC